MIRIGLLRVINIIRVVILLIVNSILFRTIIMILFSKYF